MSKKVILVDPQWKSGEFESPNIKLAYASAVLKARGYEVVVHDLVCKRGPERYSLESYEQRINDFIACVTEDAMGAALVFMNCEYGCLETCSRIAKVIRREGKLPTRQGVEIGVGGTFLNYLEAGKSLERVLGRVDCFDFVVIGETDLCLPDIAEGREPAGMHRAVGDTRILRPDAISNLDSLPFPDWGNFDLSQYDGKLYLVAARGCRFNRCRFCDEELIWGRRYRWRQHAALLAEIERNTNDFGIADYFFWDASLLSYPELISFAEGLLKSKKPIRWVGLARAAEITDEGARIIKDLGCTSIEIGIETFTPSVIQAMGKGTSEDMVRKAVEKLKRQGLFVEGSFLVGYPGETVESTLATIEKAKELGLDHYRWHNFELPAELLPEYPQLFEERWEEVNVNVPVELLPQVIKCQKGGYFDMHMVAKLGDSIPSIYPDITIGNLSLREIHELTRLAIKGTEAIASGIGHNPFI